MDEKESPIEPAEETSQNVSGNDPTATIIQDQNEDEVLSRASSDMSKNEDSDYQSPQPKKKKIKNIVVVLIILLLISAVAVWFFVLRDKNIAPAPEVQTSQESIQQPVNSGLTPDRVVYAYRESDDLPMTLYHRPAVGGERTEVFKLDKNEYIGEFDTNKNVVIFTTTKGIYASTDSGSTFNKVFELKDPPAGELGQQITSIKISTEATKIVFGLLESSGGSNSITTVDLTGTGKLELFKSENSGVFIHGYAEKSRKIVYSEGCYNCDGGLLTPLFRNLDKSEAQKLSEEIVPGTVQDIAVNNDISQVVVSHGAVNNSATEGIGVDVIAPYKITKVSTESGESMILKTIGKAGEENPNGTLKRRNILTGFAAQTNDVYYTDDKDIFLIKGTDDTKILTTESNVILTPFVSESYVVSGSGVRTEDFELSHYDVKAQQSGQILSGDNNTIILGVTTK